MEIIDSTNGHKITFRPGERVRFAMRSYRAGVAVRGTLGTLSGVRAPREDDASVERECYSSEIGRGLRDLRAALASAKTRNAAREGRSTYVVSLYDHSQRAWWPVRAAD